MQRGSGSEHGRLEHGRRDEGRRGVAIASALLAALLATGTAQAGGGHHHGPVRVRPVFVERECWWPRPATIPADTTITCGTVAVPADRRDRRPSWIQLAVARIHREGADPAAPPIVALHGGPGGNTLNGPPVGLATLPSLDQRDVITFDQRGAGRSLPSLECPEKEQAILAALGVAAPWETELANNRQAAQACRDRLVRSGVDLDDYDTPASVADMESIRRALRVETWNVFGGSYGTRLALDYARHHGERVRSLLLDSVYPPQIGSVHRTLGLPGRAVDVLADACTDDAACQASFGDLGATIDRAAASFDADPATLEASYRIGGEVFTGTFTLTGADVRGGLFSALYQTPLIPLLPSVADALARGDRSILPLFISLGVPQLLQLSEGAYLSVECADSQRLHPRGRLERGLRDAGEDGLVLLGFAQPFCGVWKVKPVPARFNRPVVVDVPTLVFGGTLDPITPHEDSAAQAARMPNARFVSAPRGGHGALTFDACTFSAALGFWEDPEAPLPACVETLTPLPFVTN
jgi:pimeloyl-ACP methyl ester carboxylesterase